MRDIRNFLLFVKKSHRNGDSAPILKKGRACILDSVRLLAFGNRRSCRWSRDTSFEISPPDCDSLCSMPQLNCDERAYARLLARELKLKPAEICEKIAEMRRSWHKAAKVRPSLGQRVTCTASSVGKFHVDSQSSACPVPFFYSSENIRETKKHSVPRIGIGYELRVRCRFGKLPRSLQSLR